MIKYNPIWECYQLPGIFGADEWRSAIEECLERRDCPYHYDIRHTTIRIWHPDDPEIKVPSSNLTCRNAYRVTRVNFGGLKQETLIGITLARLVFEPGSTLPLPFSASELFARGQYPPALRHEQSLPGIEALIHFLNQALVTKQLRHYSNYEVFRAAERIIYRFGNGSQSLVELLQKGNFSKNLLSSVKTMQAVRPAAIQLGISLENVRFPEKAKSCAREIVGVLKDWGCEVSLVELKKDEEMKNFLASESLERPIILFPLQGKRGDRPPDAEMKRLKYLDFENAAFQLCSTASNPVYSRHGLAIAILAKAGGSLFVAEPLEFPNFYNSWFVGIDIGTGGFKKGKVVAIVLTSPTGNLCAHWRSLKNEDETLSPELIADGLSWIVDRAESLSPDRDLYLIRDGLRPHRESLEFYRTALPNREFTLIEYAKSGSPLIHDRAREPEPGTAILPEASALATLYPCLAPQPGILTETTKFRVPINPKSHSLAEISLLLTALCHSATLSYQASKNPSPIQWANGIASISYTNLQFSGWSHLPNCLKRNK
ncbi:hypothetical protein [Oscillatoria sp. FACHB-1406]|uniref:hypothetical protein n=1 Tax=Oscillatoria sp. FACHB-1406 TaxID=2692846 RepID=UPI001685F0A3|nr:hypothetical protein [Oscillatoria sp. FACHB-1406]MBD2577942.1 hypothetical protein [Oscillatoria sp. FACHB-1406]